MNTRPEPTGYEMMILGGLQHQPHVYGGTVDPVVVAQRRRRNKVARKSRRQNRLAAALLIVTSALFGAAAYYDTAPAHADTGSEAAFLAAIAQHGITSTNGTAGLLSAGHEVCLDMDLVAPENNLAGGVAESDSVARRSGMSLDAAQWFVAAAVVDLCPWNAALPSSTSGVPGQVM